MPDIFGGLWRFGVAIFQIAGYTLVLVAQSIYFISVRRRDKIGNALGWYGKNVVDAFAAVLRGR